MPEWKQLVYCKTCDYVREITTHNRGGSHGCTVCDREMSVWEPRPANIAAANTGDPTGYRSSVVDAMGRVYNPDARVWEEKAWP